MSNRGHDRLHGALAGPFRRIAHTGLFQPPRVADLALERRLPAASTTRAFVDAGGLMSYGADGPALFRLGAKFVHRILQADSRTTRP